MQRKRDKERERVKVASHNEIQREIYRVYSECVEVKRRYT